MFDKRTCFNFYGLPLSIDEEEHASFIECECGDKAFIFSKGEFQEIESKN